MLFFQHWDYRYNVESATEEKLTVRYKSAETAAATGKKGGVSQTKLAGLRVRIAVRLHGVLKLTFKLYSPQSA